MQQTLSLTLEPEVALDDAVLRQYIQKNYLQTTDSEGFNIKKLRQSIKRNAAKIPAGPAPTMMA